MMKRTKYYLFLFLLLSAVSLFSEKPEESVRKRLDYIFEHIDKEKISTGLLNEYGIQFVDLIHYDGVLRDSNYVECP